MPFPRDRWYACFALAVLLGSATTADADAINLLAQTHHVWGHVQDVSYDHNLQSLNLFLMAADGEGIQ